MVGRESRQRASGTVPPLVLAPKWTDRDFLPQIVVVSSPARTYTNLISICFFSSYVFDLHVPQGPHGKSRANGSHALLNELMDVLEMPPS
jgi:hypothetical protein